MSLTSGCARSVGRVSFWVCIGQPIGIQPNRLCRNRSNYISASWRCPGTIPAMATGVFVPYWRSRAGRLVASKSSVSGVKKGLKSVPNRNVFLGKDILPDCRPKLCIAIMCGYPRRASDSIRAGLSYAVASDDHLWNPPAHPKR